MRLDYSLNLNSMLYQNKGRWTPARLFAGELSGGAIYSAQRGLFQDNAGTQPVTTPGQPVALMQDLSAQDNHAVQSSHAARPTFGRHPVRGVINRLPNNRLDGAALGVLGAGGALPAGWFWSGIANSAVSIQSLAPKNGRPCIRLRINGTPTSDMQLSFAGALTIPAAAPQFWTSSAWVQMVDGGATNITSIRLANAHFAPGAVLVNLTNGTSFLPTLAEDQRRIASGALSGATIAFSRPFLGLGWAGGAVDITLDISAPQYELAALASTVQITGANGFDVTEDGQRDIPYLYFDGIDDHMVLGTGFAPLGAYTLAAAHDLYPAPNATFSTSAGIIFGRLSGDQSRFYRGSGERINLDRVPSSNRISAQTAAVTGRTVDFASVASETLRDFSRNAVAAISYTAVDGSVLGISLNTIARMGSSYGTGRFYGGIMVPGTLTNAQRDSLVRFLAQDAGVSLP